MMPSTSPDTPPLIYTLIKSALITYGEPLTVREILNTSVSSSVVVLGSCQSALARNVQHQDEMLSIQTAIFYSGAKCVVGTSWPITDLAGFVFTVKFYGYLRIQKKKKKSWSGWYLSKPWTALVQQRCRGCESASVAEINTICDRYGAPHVSGGPQEKAFGFYEWAAIGVVGVPLSTADTQAVPDGPPGGSG